MKWSNGFRLAPNRVWRTYLGGKFLDVIAGEEDPKDSHFPEDWILSTVRANNPGRENNPEEGISTVQTGDGPISLKSLAEKDPESLFGPEHLKKWGDNPGFLLKYLDSSIRLPMQCHPSIPFAKKFLNSSFGKTEGYYILGVRPECEGYLYLGFQHPPKKEDFKQAVLTGNIPEMLNGFEKIPVKRGDCFYVPGGIPHAIGEGIFMIEMMEPTDFAVRLESKCGEYTLPESARFMNRGIDFALSMFDYTGRSAEETKHDFFIEPRPLPVEGNGVRNELFGPKTTKCFRAESIQTDKSVVLNYSSMAAIVVVEGNGRLNAGGEEMELKQFDRILIPYSAGKIEFSGSLKLFAAMPETSGSPDIP